jgi:1-aminocyclopropane-1-carboxylate deaminase
LQRLFAKTPSPIQEVSLPSLKENGIRLLVKRDDLLHPFVYGNKYRKLKYNLAEAVQRRAKPVVTFGGAFSNHLYATAAACHIAGLSSVAFVRGEDDPLNPTLRFCRENGMQLFFMDRSSYRLKEQAPSVIAYLQQHPDHYLLPEGGTNDLALVGASEIWEEMGPQLDCLPEFIVLSAGTGGTAAGLLQSLPAGMQMLVFTALKSAHFTNEITTLAGAEAPSSALEICHDYTFGGYGKWDDSLVTFIQSFLASTGIPLDPVYTGKAMYGLLDRVKNQHFPRGSTLLFLHTGGLQGWNGLLYLQQMKEQKLNQKAT